jgi:hypothetical protein
MHNQSFTNGDFTGYTVKGRCKVVKFYRHQPENSANRIKKPSSGTFMALLDDPMLIDDDGKRIKKADMPEGYAETEAFALDFIHPTTGVITPAYTIPFPEHHSGTSAQTIFTSSRDGAFIEVQHKMKEFSLLTVRWDFLIGEHANNALALNDFALLTISDADNDQLEYREVLSQASDISQTRWSTGWQSFTWLSPRKINAKIRIVVCNGYSYNSLNRPTSSQLIAARSYPSGLLVDCICVTGG